MAAKDVVFPNTGETWVPKANKDFPILKITGRVSLFNGQHQGPLIVADDEKGGVSVALDVGFVLMHFALRGG